MAFYFLGYPFLYSECSLILVLVFVQLIVSFSFQLNRDSLLENPLWKPPKLTVLMGKRILLRSGFKHLHNEGKNWFGEYVWQSRFFFSQNKNRSLLETRGNSFLQSSLWIVYPAPSVKRSRMKIYRGKKISLHHVGNVDEDHFRGNTFCPPRRLTFHRTYK